MEIHNGLGLVRGEGDSAKAGRQAGRLAQGPGKAGRGLCRGCAFRCGGNRCYGSVRFHFRDGVPWLAGSGRAFARKHPIHRPLQTRGTVCVGCAVSAALQGESAYGGGVGTQRHGVRRVNRLPPRTEPFVARATRSNVNARVPRRPAPDPDTRDFHPPQSIAGGPSASTEQIDGCCPVWIEVRSRGWHCPNGCERPGADRPDPRRAES